MNTERQRELFASFLKENENERMIRLGGVSTVQQDELLKYERIDRYKVLFLPGKELKKLLSFCVKHNISMWFGAERLCIGYNYAGNMRLDAFNNYCSVLPGKSCSEKVPDRNSDELRAAATAHLPL